MANCTFTNGLSMARQCLVFMKFSCQKQLNNQSNESDIFSNTHIQSWPLRKICINKECLPSPRLILISGSGDFLASINIQAYYCPALFSLEVKVELLKLPKSFVLRKY